MSSSVAAASCGWRRTTAVAEGRQRRGHDLGQEGGAQAGAVGPVCRRREGRGTSWWLTSRRSCGGGRKSRIRKATHRKPGHRQLGHSNAGGCAGTRGGKREAEDARLGLCEQDL
jgi:hypothetical protein